MIYVSKLRAGHVSTCYVNTYYGSLFINGFRYVLKINFETKGNPKIFISSLKYARR